MVKLVAITAVGTFGYPWLQHAVAAIYNIVDEIVVVNAGFSDDFSRDDVPLERESKAIKEIDVNGKIFETSDVYWGRPAEGVDVNEPRAYWGVRSDADGVAARNFTIANRIALDRGAEWILRVCADQVFYENARLIPQYIAKHPSCGYQFLEHDGWALDIYHRFKDAESIVSDGALLYRTTPGDCHIGGCAPMIQPQTLAEGVEDICTAHFRDAYPDWTIDKIKEEVHKKMWKRWHMNLRKKASQQEIEMTATEKEKLWWKSIEEERESAKIPPPLICKTGSLKYIREGRPK